MNIIERFKLTGVDDPNFKVAIGFDMFERDVDIFDSEKYIRSLLLINDPTLQTVERLESIGISTEIYIDVCSTPSIGSDIKKMIDTKIAGVQNRTMNVDRLFDISDTKKWTSTLLDKNAICTTTNETAVNRSLEKLEKKSVTVANNFKNSACTITDILKKIKRNQSEKQYNDVIK